MVILALGSCVSASTDLRGPRGPFCCFVWRRECDGMRPGAHESDAKMRGTRPVTVGTRAPSPPDVRAARTASGSMHASDEQMSVGLVSVCML